MTRRSDARRPDAGFSLIEVLIAMVILSVGLLALEGLSVGSAKMTARAARRSYYTTQAADAMERTLSALREGQAAATGTTDVKNTQGTTIAKSTVSTTSTAISAGGLALTRYDVTVRVVPVTTTELTDSVNMVGSVIR